jgi:glycosyltransferase involved in cell wall biosynthesis
MDDPIVSVVMPCLNEEETIGRCIEKAGEGLKNLNLPGEIVVADNGSTDRSVEIARSLGARVVHQPLKGYGSAYLKGVEEAKGQYLVMGDSDLSYDFVDIPRFVKPLQEGYDLVMGSRLKGEIRPGAMPWLHRYFGNPFLSWFLNLLFKTGVSDAHCGMRAFTREAWKRMDLRSRGMEFASEMVIQAGRKKLKIKEVPIILYPDGRSGRPHLKSFRDGWRHMRLMLLFSPSALFILPGFLLLVLGLIFLVIPSFGIVYIYGIGLDIHTMVLGSLLAILGFGIFSLGIFSRLYAYLEKFEEPDAFINLIKSRFSLNEWLFWGLVLTLLGVIANLAVVYQWASNNFILDHNLQLRPALWGLTLIALGVQVIFSAFFVSLLLMKEEYPR